MPSSGGGAAVFVGGLEDRAAVREMAMPWCSTVWLYRRVIGDVLGEAANRGVPRLARRILLHPVASCWILLHPVIFGWSRASVEGAAGKQAPVSPRSSRRLQCYGAAVLLCCCVAVLLCCCVAVLLTSQGDRHRPPSITGQLSAGHPRVGILAWKEGKRASG
jgi:hypothetical protein